MNNDAFARKLIRAANQRMTSAEILFREAMFLDSMYLAGYCVECSLKALLIARSRSKRRSSILNKAFQGKAGHSYENLKSLLVKAGVAFPTTIAKQLRVVSTWSTDLRYEVGRGSSEDTAEFLKSTDAIRSWSEVQI